MNTETSTAKIIADIRTKICIDDFDAEVIKAALNEYCNELNEYYEVEYYNEVSRARNMAYDSGYDDAYSCGYAAGHSEGRTEGYADGYDVGYDDCNSENHSAV